jgi:hypothetical protein
MVTPMMDDDLRNEIARASEAHDRLLAADAADAANVIRYTEPPLGNPPVRRAADSRGLVYRPRGDTPADAPAPAPLPSNDDGSIFDTVRDKRLAKAIGLVAAELRREFDDEVELLHQLANVARVEIDKLRGESRVAVARLKREFAEMDRRLESAVSGGIEVVCTNVEHRLATLEGENIRLRAMLAARAAENAQPPRGRDQNDDKIKALAAELENERRDRAALFDKLENNLHEMRAFLKGTIRDWNAV